jgi:hypothetical protein
MAYSIFSSGIRIFISGSAENSSNCFRGFPTPEIESRIPPENPF